MQIKIKRRRCIAIPFCNVLQNVQTNTLCDVTRALRRRAVLAPQGAPRFECNIGHCWATGRWHLDIYSFHRLRQHRKHPEKSKYAHFITKNYTVSKVPCVSSCRNSTFAFLDLSDDGSKRQNVPRVISIHAIITLPVVPRVLSGARVTSVRFVLRYDAIFKGLARRKLARHPKVTELSIAKSTWLQSSQRNFTSTVRTK